VAFGFLTEAVLLLDMRELVLATLDLVALLGFVTLVLERVLELTIL
jgi:hypothetical protein